MRDIKITATNKKTNETETKIISEIELGNIVDKGDDLTNIEKVLFVLNEIICTMHDSIDLGYEQAASEFGIIAIEPMFGMFNVSTFVDPSQAKTISNFTDCSVDILELLDYEKITKNYTSEKFHFLLRKLTEIRTEILKGVKIYEVSVLNTETKEYYKLSDYCSSYSVGKSGLVDIYKPRIIQIVDNECQITLTPVTGTIRKNVINTSIYKRRVGINSLTETITKCVQAICNYS